MSASLIAAFDATFGDRLDDPNHELRRFVDDYCGCGPAETADHVDQACDDAALMLAHPTAG